MHRGAHPRRQETSFVRRSSLALPLLAVLLVRPPAAFGDEGDAAAAAAAIDAALAAAEESLRDGEPQVAESRYRSVLETGWLVLGELAWSTGDPEAARTAFARAAGATVDHRRASTAQALAELETGRDDAARQRLQGLLAEDPSDLAVRRLLAEALAAAGRHEEALQELDEARALAPEDPELLFSLGIASLRAGQIEAAEARFEELFRRRPIPATRVLLGRTYRDFGEYERARRELRRALELDPRTPRAHLYLGTLHLLAEGRAELDQAIAELERELELYREDPTANLFLGMALVEGRRHAAALAPLESARRDPSTAAEASHFLGRALLGLDRPAEAVAALRRALDRAGDGTGGDERLRSIHYQLGLALRRSGDPVASGEHLAAAERLTASLTEESRDELSRLIGEEGGSAGGRVPRLAAPRFAALAPPERAALQASAQRALARSYLNLGILQARAGRAERAAALVSLAAELAPDLPGVQRTLGVVLFEAGEHARAVEPLARASRQAPADGDLRRMLGLAHLESERYPEAAAILAEVARRAAAEASPEDAAIAYAYGLALARSGRPEAAEAVFADLLARHADSPRIHVLLGQAQAQQGDFAAAVDHLERALALDPEVAEARPALGVIHLRRGELEPAERALRDELDRRPDDVRTRFHLATVLDLRDLPEAAVGELRRVLALDPAHADARYLLGKILLAGGEADEALAELETAAELAPREPNVRYQLGRAYQALERPAEARAQFDLFRELKDGRGTEGEP
jgi:tetratricopeptide (TPR) repeat protein